MATAKLQIVIDAQNNATRAFKQVEGTLKKSSKAFNAVTKAAKITAVAFGVVSAAAIFMGKKAVSAAVEMENALVGLKTVARAFGQDMDEATGAARALASDGLLTVKEAANGLKNLLGAGFGMEESIKLMEGFKDSAAFNRQGMLSLGQAVEGATQGIKNQNSIMVDNAGITKNLSIIMKEQGLSIHDLANVQGDANVRAKLYNGLLKEMAVFEGDAVKATDTLGGAISKTNAVMFEINALIGQELSPVVTELNKHLTDTLNRFIDVREDGTKELKPEIKALFSELSEKLIPAMNSFIDTLIKAIGWLIENKETIAKVWKAMKQLGKIIWSIIKIIIKALSLFQKALEKLFQKGFELIDRFKRDWESLKETLSKPLKGVINIYKKVKGEKDDDDHRAVGGSVTGGKPYLVGERGPELFVPSSNGRIENGATNNNTSNVFNFNFSGAVIGDKNELIREIKNVINREQELNQLGAM